MKRILYHGSDHIIEEPLLNYGNKHSDYGLGFYCTSNLQLAKEWATRKNGVGFVNKYTIRDDRFNVLDLTDPEHDDILKWISLLMKNRTVSEDLKMAYPREFKYLFDNYLIDTSKYDCIIGYRADDAYFRFPEAFIRGDITLETLNEVYRLGELGKQYVIVSQRAFNNLHFIDYMKAEENERVAYYSRKEKADKRYLELLEADRYSNKTRLRDLVIKNG